MKNDEKSMLLLHAICCGVPLLIVLGISLAPLVAAFLATRWYLLALGLVVLAAGAWVWRWRLRRPGCADLDCIVPPAPEQRVDPSS